MEWGWELLHEDSACFLIVLMTAHNEGSLILTLPLPVSMSFARDDFLSVYTHRCIQFAARAGMLTLTCLPWHARTGMLQRTAVAPSLLLFLNLPSFSPD